MKLVRQYQRARPAGKPLVVFFSHGWVQIEMKNSKLLELRKTLKYVQNFDLKTDKSLPHNSISSRSLKRRIVRINYKRQQNVGNKHQNPLVQ